jgi:hypothetical protein
MVKNGRTMIQPPGSETNPFKKYKGALRSFRSRKDISAWISEVRDGAKSEGDYSTNTSGQSTTLVKVDDLAESLPNVGQQAERSAWPSFRKFYRHQCTFRFWSADASATPSLRDQQELSGGFAAFEIAMSLLRFGQRISMRNSDLELPVRNHVEDRA